MERGMTPERGETCRSTLVPTVGIKGDVHTVGRELRRLIEDEGHTRLVVNFAGVRYLSTEVLGILVGLQKKVDPVRGSIVLCGLDPLLRDMVRIVHLDRVFDICGDEAEALGRMLHT
jgi:anti-sigma B factor antagonist